MVICETSEQARRLYDCFVRDWEKAQPKPIQIKLPDGTTVVGEPTVPYNAEQPLRAGLILYDSDDKETRKQIVKDFKKNMTIDILIVFNMLLTGFDAPRLKRLYFGRKLKDHNLLQAITRVNRPYKNMRYGYLIDFANIKRNFDETNEAYLRELNRFNDVDETGEGNATDTFAQVIEDKEEILNQMKEIRDILFDYSHNNAEDFSSEISTQEDKKVLLDLKHALELAKNIANIVRTFGDDDMKEKFSHLEITKLPELLTEVQHRIDIINQKEAFERSDETKFIINEAMKDIEFTFSKIGQEEMHMIAGGIELKEKWQRTISSFTSNIDQDDPEFISLKEAFRERFKEHGFVIDSIAKFNEETAALDDIITRLRDIQKRNDALLKKYHGDAKFARVHKRIREVNKEREQHHQKPMFSFHDDEIMVILNMIKEDVDSKVYDRNDILKRDAYFSSTVMTLINDCLYHFPQIEPEMEDYTFIQSRISQQYINQYNATYGA
jgi:type I restriction enzyme R subunit